MDSNKVMELIEKVYDGSFKDVNFEERCEFVEAVNEMFINEMLSIINEEFLDEYMLNRLKTCPAVDNVRKEGVSTVYEGYNLYTVEFLNGDEYEVYSEV